jgi:8-oxo-dGTP pyrophosphatase MutT (NUDIX family)
MTYPFDDTLRQHIRNHIHEFNDRRAPENGLKHAAVSVVVIDHGGEAAFILTKRSPRLNAHSGQFALPGGRVDAGETALDAALREMREEINVSLSADHLLGTLDDYGSARISNPYPTPAKLQPSTKCCSVIWRIRKRRNSPTSQRATGR